MRERITGVQAEGGSASKYTISVSSILHVCACPFTKDAFCHTSCVPWITQVCVIDPISVETAKGFDTVPGLVE